jgi:hypothetical protein
MQKAKNFLVVNLILYPIFCFISAKINPFEWISLLRAFYVFFVILNWYALNKTTI